MGTLGPSLHQGMERLVVRTSLLAGKCENKALESGVTDPSSNEVRERVVPSPSAAEVPSSFEGVGVELRNKQGSVFKPMYLFMLRLLTLGVDYVLKDQL